MLEVEVIFLLGIEPTKDEQPRLKLVATATHSRQDWKVGSYKVRNLPENVLLGDFRGDIDGVRDWGGVGFVEHFVDDCLEEVKLGGPEQYEVVFGLMIIPVTPHHKRPWTLYRRLIVFQYDGDSYCFFLLNIFSVFVGLISEI